MAARRKPTSAQLQELTDLYTTMVRIRAFEERVAKHFRDGDVHGFVHVSIGQEAVAAGVCAALRNDDLITTTHRGHGHCIAKGAEPTPMMAELFGRATGLCAGKGGSMHLADAKLGILGANGIVGAGIPLATGAALAAQVRGSDQVAVGFFGEGALHAGAFHEAASLAVAWRLPLVLVCERNGYAEFTSTESWGGPEPVERARSYGISAESIDGSDVEAVATAAAEMISAARGGAGPWFLEAKTVRFGGHYEGDAQRYRNPEELRSRDDFDPLKKAATGLPSGTVTAVKKAAEAEMDAAVQTACDAPYPHGTVLEDVYA